MNLTQIIHQIQSIVAPAVMISSSALMLLGFNAKFSNLANRFRSLCQEEELLAGKETKNPGDERRLANLKEQVEALFRRADCLKNSILLTYVAILCFTGTSILILINIYFSLELYYSIILAFALGLVCLMVMGVLMFLETRLFYAVLKLEKMHPRSS